MKNNFHLRWCFLCLQGKKCAVKYFSPKLLCRWKTFFLIIFPGHKAHWTINGPSFCFPRWYVTSFMSFNGIFVVKKTRHSSQVPLRHWKKFSSNGLFMVIDLTDTTCNGERKETSSYAKKSFAWPRQIKFFPHQFRFDFPRYFSCLLWMFDRKSLRNRFPSTENRRNLSRTSLFCSTSISNFYSDFMPESKAAKRRRRKKYICWSMKHKSSIWFPPGSSLECWNAFEMEF